MNWLKKNSGFFIVLFLSFWTVRPLFVAGFFPMHDDTQVARVYEMAKALSDGMVPVRWVPDLGYGYGYPLFNFYGPLAYYIGGFFVLFHINALLATKLMMGIGMLLAGVSMYVLGRKVWGEMGGITSALFYMYAPYHAVDLYVRGAVGEFWAYAFIPWVFYGLYMVYREKKWKFVSIGSLAYAGVILSHNLTAMMLTPFLLVVLLVSLCLGLRKRQFSIFNFQFSILFLGLLLSAFYWLPALLEMPYTNVSSQVGGSADFRNHFVCLPQLWHSPWGFGGSAIGCLDGLSFMVGKLHVIFVVLACIGVFFLWRKEKEKAVLIVVSAFLFFLSGYLMLEISKPLWELIPQIAFIQYPWRFLTFTCFFSSFLIGLCIFVLQTRKHISRLVFILVILLIFFSYSKFFVPQTITTKTVADYTSFGALRWDVSKKSDEYMPANFIKVDDPHDTVNGNFMVDNDVIIDFQKEKTQIIQATIFVKKNYGSIQILLAHFPAWHIFVDGKPVFAKKTNRGFIVQVGQGKHTIKAVFQQTNVEKIGNALSVIGFGVIIIGIMYPTKKGKLSA